MHSHLTEDTQKSERLKNLLEQNGFLKNELGIAVIDLKQSEHKIFGYNMDHFMYPASVYKIFIGAEMLRQIEIGNFKLDQKVIVKSPNDVDKDSKLFPGDPRGLLQVGDSVAIDYLLDLMLTRSDNSASNCLIDLVSRESITEHIIHKYGWDGSEVTRKFLDRIREDKKYRYSETTKICARHAAEFMYMVEQAAMISEFVSSKLKDYMTRWNREGRQGLTISEYLFIYRKGGYLENDLYQNVYKGFYHKSGFGLDYVAGIFHLLKTIITKGWAFICWSNDVAVVTGENTRYIISVFTLIKSINPRKRFPMKELAKVVHQLMEENK
jgi:hypothetical protein